VNKEFRFGMLGDAETLAGAASRNLGRGTAPGISAWNAWIIAWPRRKLNSASSKSGSR
jgi:hypothetical protein